MVSCDHRVYCKGFYFRCHYMCSVHMTLYDHMIEWVWTYNCQRCYCWTDKSFAEIEPHTVYTLYSITTKILQIWSNTETPS